MTYLSNPTPQAENCAFSWFCQPAHKNGVEIIIIYTGCLTPINKLAYCDLACPRLAPSQFRPGDKATVGTIHACIHVVFVWRCMMHGCWVGRDMLVELSCSDTISRVNIHECSKFTGQKTDVGAYTEEQFVQIWGGCLYKDVHLWSVHLA